MKLKTFKRFILTEKIHPSQINYGTDLSNQEWIEYQLPTESSLILNFKGVKDTLFFTFFEYKGRYYQVYLSKDGIQSSNAGFTSSSSFSKEIMTSNNIIDIGLYLDKHFTLELINDKRAIGIFNSVFYVIIEGLKKYKIRNFKMQAPLTNEKEEVSRLDKFYDKIFNRTDVMKTMKQWKILFLGKKGKLFAFKVK